MGAFLPRSSFPSGLEPGGNTWQRTGISVSLNRIGVLDIAGTNAANHEWVELDPDGKPLGRYPLQGFEFAHAAITADDRVFTQNGYHQPLLLLNRATGKWNAMPLAMTHELFGSDGKQLVYASWEHGSVVLERGDTRGLPMDPSSIEDLR